jgi:nitrate/nitrite transporter NarK
MIPYFSSLADAHLFGVLLGATNGIFRAISAVVWPSDYGRAHLGSIYGFTTAAGVLGAALGPLPFGVVYDLWGAYLPALYSLAALSTALGLLSLWIRKPQIGERNQREQL